MFRGDGQSVEENQEDDQPIENLWFDRRPALSPTQPVPPPRVSAEEEEAKIEGERWRGYERRREKRRELWQVKEKRDGAESRRPESQTREKSKRKSGEEIREKKGWSTETSEETSEKQTAEEREDKERVS